MDKAKFRIRMEGLAPDQQELVLAEFPGVLAETISVEPSPMPSGYPSEAPSVRGEAAEMEPFEEPLPAQPPHEQNGTFEQQSTGDVPPLYIPPVPTSMPPLLPTLDVPRQRKPQGG